MSKVEWLDVVMVLGCWCVNINFCGGKSEWFMRTLVWYLKIASSSCMMEWISEITVHSPIFTLWDALQDFHPLSFLALCEMPPSSVSPLSGWPCTKHQPTLTKSEIKDRRLNMKTEVSLVGVPGHGHLTNVTSLKVWEFCCWKLFRKCLVQSTYSHSQFNFNHLISCCSNRYKKHHQYICATGDMESSTFSGTWNAGTGVRFFRCTVNVRLFEVGDSQLQHGIYIADLA